MALIICKSCGKRVSDTAEKCIHCGASLKEEIIEEVLQKEEEKAEEPSGTKEEQPKLIDYAYYNEDDRLELQKEFHKSDKWARKYLQRDLEAHYFLRAFFTPAILIFIINILMLNFDSALSYAITSHLQSPLGKFAWRALYVSVVIMLIPFSIIKTHHKVTDAKYVYMKKFQRWLKENKGIEYTPPLIKIKQKEKFDSIVID